MLRVCLGFILTFCFRDHFLYSLLHNNYLTIWAVSKWSLTKSHCEFLLQTELANELKSQSACDSSDVRTWHMLARFACTRMRATCLHTWLACMQVQASCFVCKPKTLLTPPPPFFFLKGVCFFSFPLEWVILHICRPDRRRDVFSAVLANS